MAFSTLGEVSGRPTRDPCRGITRFFLKGSAHPSIDGPGREVIFLLKQLMSAFCSIVILFSGQLRQETHVGYVSDSPFRTLNMSP
jgi:hypothetical protein